jgi:hypothetical protein
MHQNTHQNTLEYKYYHIDCRWTCHSHVSFVSAQTRFTYVYHIRLRRVTVVRGTTRFQSTREIDCESKHVFLTSRSDARTHSQFLPGPSPFPPGCRITTYDGWLVMRAEEGPMACRGVEGLRLRRYLENFHRDATAALGCGIDPCVNLVGHLVATRRVGTVCSQAPVVDL